MTALEIHHLFNDLNQAKPSFFLDMRSDELFKQCHLRNAKNLSPEDCLQIELVTLQMAELRDHNQIALVFLTDSSTNPSLLAQAMEAAKKWTEEAKASPESYSWGPRWKNIFSIAYIDFESFLGAYPQCSSLYIGSRFPKKKESIPGKLYPTDILPQFLYLGSYYDANEVVVMTELGITHVVDATSENLSGTTSAKLGLNYLPIPVWDMEGVNIAEHFDTVLAFVEAARVAQGRVLIHCRAGISRSATFVLAYLMHSGRVPSLRAALKLVVEQRPYVLPNPSFREQLMAYEMSLFSTRSFENDLELLAFVSTMNFCWSGIFSLETDFDKIPVIAASQRINYQKLLDEFPAEGSQEGSSEGGEMKPKKEFLKRGQRKPVIQHQHQQQQQQQLEGQAGGSTTTAGEDAVKAVLAAEKKPLSIKQRLAQQAALKAATGAAAAAAGASGGDDGGSGTTASVEVPVEVLCAGSGAVAVKAMRVSSPAAATTGSEGGEGGVALLHEGDHTVEDVAMAATAAAVASLVTEVCRADEVKPPPAETVTMAVSSQKTEGEREMGKGKRGEATLESASPEKGQKTVAAASDAAMKDTAGLPPAVLE